MKDYTRTVGTYLHLHTLKRTTCECVPFHLFLQGKQIQVFYIQKRKMCVACLSAILDFFYTITTSVVSHSILSHSALYINVCLDYVGTRYCIGKYTVCLWMPEQPIIIHWHINKSLPSLPAENICICFMCSVVTLYFLYVPWTGTVPMFKLFPKYVQLFHSIPSLSPPPSIPTGSLPPSIPSCSL